MPRLLAAVADQGPFSGIKGADLSRIRITLEISSDISPGTISQSQPINGVNVLPPKAVHEWGEEDLQRVVRHELAHIGLGAILGYQGIPIWFHEGFAEWSTGGLTCEGEVRIRLDLLGRRSKGNPGPRLFGHNGMGRSRLSYDYFATFFEFLEARRPGVISSGVLLESVGDFGVLVGTSRVIGIKVEELEDRWLQYVLVRYDGLPVDFSCRDR